MLFIYDKRHVSNFLFGVMLILGIILLVRLIQPVLGALGIAVVLVYFLHPIVEHILPIVKRRWLALFLTLVLILIPSFILFIVFMLEVISQLTEVAKIPQINELMNYFGKNIQNYLVAPPELGFDLTLSTISNYRGGFIEGLSTLVIFLTGVGNILLQLFIGIFFSLYILYKEEVILEFFKSIKNENIREYFIFINDGLKQVVYSQFVTILVTGIVATAVYWAFDIPFAVLFGFMTGIFALIPAGTYLVFTPIALYHYTQTGLIVGAISFIIMILTISSFPDVVVRPLVAAKNIDVGFMVLGFICGLMVFGTIGLLLGPLIFISSVGFIKVFLFEKEKGTN